MLSNQQILNSLMATSNGSHADDVRIDASDLAWFVNELKYIDAKQYMVLVEENVANRIVPRRQDIPDWARSYEWTEWRNVGEAKFIGNNADDLPRVDVGGKPYSRIIQPIGDSYAYTFFDIKRALRSGQRLDVMRAAAARWAIETKIDRVLARGSTSYGLEGLLNLTGVVVTTATTKTGGGTYWSAAAKPAEILADIYKLINAIMLRLQNAAPQTADGEQNGPMFRRFRIAMPDANYLYLQQTILGDNTGRTLFDILSGQPYIESIVPWSQCVGAAANGTDDRIVAFPPSEFVVSGIVPMEFTPLNPQERGLEFVVPCVATTGGVVTQYPIALGYMDTIDVTAF